MFSGSFLLRRVPLQAISGQLSVQLLLMARCQQHVDTWITRKNMHDICVYSTWMHGVPLSAIVCVLAPPPPPPHIRNSNYLTEHSGSNYDPSSLKGSMATSLALNEAHRFSRWHLARVLDP